MIRIANLLFPDLPIIGYDNCADMFHSVRRQDRKKSEPVHKKSSFPKDWAHYTMECRQCQAWPGKAFPVFRFSGRDMFAIINMINSCRDCLCMIRTERESMKTDRRTGILSIFLQEERTTAPEPAEAMNRIRKTAGNPKN